MELIQIKDDWNIGHCADDPVRGHLPLAYRISNGREVYALQNEDSIVQAVICVAYTTEVPTNEQELTEFSTPDGDIAIFYTVWSYAKGAGRDMVLRAADHIKNNKNVKRYVTLSPKTEMAMNFHLRNGAEWVSENTESNNFEYTL